MTRRRQQPSTALTERDRARIPAAVSTALATIETRFARPGAELVRAEPRNVPEDDRFKDRHGRARDPGWRSLAHRNRRQLLPWTVMLAVAITGYFAAVVGWLLQAETVVAQGVAASSATGVAVLLVVLRTKRVHRYWGSWLTLCASAAGAWITTTAFVGFDYQLLVALYGATCLLGLRWWRHVRHPYPYGTEDDRLDAGERGARLLQDWADNAGCPGGPMTGARLVRLIPYEHGYTGEIWLVRGRQSLGDIQSALPRLSTALDVPMENLIVEAHPDGPPSRLRVQIVTRSPVKRAVFFDQPVYRDGRILLGPYADGIGEATFVLYTDDSMESGYVLGSKGSGKSCVLETVALTAIACTPTAMFYIDGQNGASSPLLWQHALWHAGPEHAHEMIRSLLSDKDYRQLYNRRYQLTGFTPSGQLPGILVIVDECHKIFTDTLSARWADLAREGRKVGIGILAASQVTTLDAFGGGAHADALRSSLVSSNGIALRTASKVQSSVFPGLSVDLMALPKLPGFGYTVDDGDDQHRTAPFRNRWLIGATQAAQRGSALPDGINTAEDWFTHVAPRQRLDNRSAHAAGGGLPAPGRPCRGGTGGTRAHIRHGARCLRREAVRWNRRGAVPGAAQTVRVHPRGSGSRSRHAEGTVRRPLRRPVPGVGRHQPRRRPHRRDRQRARYLVCPSPSPVSRTHQRRACPARRTRAVRHRPPARGGQRLMSIKVMTWVWDHSPVAGTELLLLLAIADQANDDGRDAWPSTRTLARRTRLDERTVRRVLKRLADSGQLVVHSGGGRRSNHYEIPMSSKRDELSTPRADRHPGQSATPGKSTGVPGQDTRAALTQLCPATPDTAAPPDPSSTRSVSTLLPRLRVMSSEDGGGAYPHAVLAQLGPEWTLSPGQRRRLAPMVTAALASGWTPAQLVDHLAANPDGVRSPAAVLAARLEDLPEPAAVTSRPPWCGDCDETTRHRERRDGTIERCPSCNPRRASPPAAGDEPARHRSRQAPTPRRAGSQVPGAGQ